MRRGLWVLAGLGVLAGITWACWPGAEEGSPSNAASPSGEPAKATRSLAEQLDEVDRSLDAADAGRGLVFGVVENEAGEPVSGAEVRVFEAGGHALTAATCPVCGQPILECTDVHTAREVLEVVQVGRGRPRQLAVTTTGPDGAFHFDDLPQQELELVARQGDQAARGFNLPGEAALLQLAPSARLSLQLVRGSFDLDSTQGPVAGAKVTALSLDSFALQQAVSDGVGKLRLDGLDQGSGVWLFVEAPGLLPLVATVFSDLEDTQVAVWPSRALVVRTTVGGRPAETTVKVVPSSGQHPITAQTQGGSVRFEGLDHQGCDVSASSGSMVAPPESIDLELELTTFELELRAAAKLLVTVIDEAGDPVANAEVTASGRAGDYHSDNSLDGALVIFEGLGEGFNAVNVNHADYRPWQRNLDLHPGDNPLEVVLKKGVKIRGKVVDAGGKPAAQAEVVVHAPGTPDADAYTDFDGSFELSFDEPGPQELTALLNTAGRARVTVQAPADGVVIKLEPRARLRVAVREGNAPLANVSVTVTGVSSESVGNTVTDEAGVAMISGLEAGSYEVTVHHTEFRQPPIAAVSLVEGRLVTLDVPLDRGLTVSGRVVDARGAPVPGAEVATEPWTSSAMTDDEGLFTLTALDPAGVYRVEATTDTQYSAPQQIQGPQRSLQLVLGGRPVVSGRVVDAATGAAVPQFVIDGQPIEAADGRFSIPLRVHGERVVLSVGGDGFETLSWEGVIEANQDLGTLRLQRAKVVEGVVRDVRGNPVAGALVTSDSIDEEVTSAADGTFRIALSQFEPGSQLVAQRGQLLGSAPIQLARLIEIVLQPPTRVLGQVIDAAGRPAPGRVKLREANSAEELQVEAGADGAFTIDVAPGRWVFHSRVSSAGQTFAISGASTRVVLGAPPGTCAVAVAAAAPPDELLLLPGDVAPDPAAAYEALATLEGAVLFDTLTAPRLLRAAGFRCGPYTLVARWGSLQRVQRIEAHSGGPVEVLLALPPELSAAAPAPVPEAH